MTRSRLITAVLLALATACGGDDDDVLDLNGHPPVPDGGPSDAARPDAAATDAAMTASDGGSTSGACFANAPDYLVLGVDNGCARACGCASCWGVNNRGQLGIEARGQVWKPVPVVQFADALSLSIGTSTSCYVSSGHYAFCVGQEWGGKTPSDLPTAYASDKAMVEISIGANTACARTAEGEVTCWGADDQAQVGDGWDAMLTGLQKQPVVVAGGARHLAGRAFTCMVDGLREADCWGLDVPGRRLFRMQNPGESDDDYRLAVDKYNQEDKDVWTDVRPMMGSHISRLDAIGVGVGFACGLSGGKAICWGNGYQPAPDGNIVVTLPADNLVQLSVGYQHACAVQQGGHVLCWGKNDFGQLGDGTQMERKEPVVVGGSDFRAARVAAGSQHTCAQKDDGSVWCWGLAKEAGLGQGDQGKLLEASPVQTLPACR